MQNHMSRSYIENVPFRTKQRGEISNCYHTYLFSDILFSHVLVVFLLNVCVYMPLLYSKATYLCTDWGPAIFRSSPEFVDDGATASLSSQDPQYISYFAMWDKNISQASFPFCHKLSSLALLFKTKVCPLLSFKRILLRWMGRTKAQWWSSFEVLSLQKSFSWDQVLWGGGRDSTLPGLWKVLSMMQFWA